MPWTLTLNGTDQPLDQWPAQNVRLQRQNLQADLLTFQSVRRRFDDDELCAFGDTAILTDEDGRVWFRGTRQLVDREAGTSSESQSYQFLGPWRFLSENIYQQPWGVGAVLTSHLIINGTIGQIIKAVLDRAILQGALFQYLQADLDALAAIPVPNEITGQFMENVILSALQFAPDVQSRCDYSTEPPTLRFQKRSALTATSVRLADYEGDSTLPAVHVQSLRSRPDLQLPSVKINYETIVTTDGVQTIIPGVEIYPPGATGLEDGAFTDTVVLQGRTTNNIFGEIECQTVNPTNLEWLKQHIHTLRDPRVTILTGPTEIERVDEDGVAIPLADQLPRELIFGTIAPWMRHDNDDPVLYQREFFRLKLSYQTIDDETAGAASQTKLEVKDDAQFTFEIITTDAPDGLTSYSAISDIEFGDPPISGLAQYLYDSLNPLQYDGAMILVEDECTGALDLGQVINLFGSRNTDYETMRALVQQVTFNLDTGTTEIILGPPRHLTLGDLLALLERFRTSRRWTNPDTQETGEIGTDDSGDLALGKATPNNNTIPGAGATKLLTVKDPASSDLNKYIRLAIEDLDGTDPATARTFTNKNVRLRLITVCVRNAAGITEEKYAGVLMTEPWSIT